MLLKKIINQNDILFIGLIILCCVLSAPFHHGIYLYDDGDYSKAAYQMATGHFPARPDFHDCRWGSYFLPMLAIKVWGFNEQLTWVTTFEFVLLLSAIYFFMRSYNNLLAIIAVAFLACSRIFIEQSSQLMGDTMETLMVNMPVLLYFCYRTGLDKGKQRSTALWGAIAGLFFVGAVLTKESAIFFIPLLLGLGYTDRKDKELKKFWLWMAVITMAGGILTCGYYWMLTGSPLYRLHIVESGPSSSSANYHHEPLSVLFSRLSYQPFQFFVQYFDFGVLLLFSALSFCLKKGEAWQPKFLATYLLGTLMIWWLGTQSLSISHWNPVALVDRLWLPVIIPMSLNAALLFSRLIGNELSEPEKRKLSMFSAVFLLLALISLYFSYQGYVAHNIYQDFFWVGLRYIIITLFLFFILFFGGEQKADISLLPPLKAWLFWLILGFQLFSLVVLFVLWAGDGHLTKYVADTKYKEGQEAISKVTTLNPSVILSDFNMKKKYGVFNSFQKELPFIDYDSTDLNAVAKGTFLLINKDWKQTVLSNVPETHIYTGPDNRTQPKYILNPDAYGFRLVWQNNGYQVYVFNSL